MRVAATSGITVLLLASLVAGTNAAKSQTAPPVADSAVDPADQPYRITLDLNLVILPVTVLDKNGGFVSDLREQDFRIYEDGARQSIHLFLHEDIPVTVGLVID